MPLLLSLAILLVGLFAIFVLVMRFLRRRKALVRDVPAAESNCTCGYPLKGLETLRCPECGRVVGFDATPEDLGLSDEQLKRAMEKRRERES